MVSDRAGGECMISIEGTQEMVDRWEAHLKYTASLGSYDHIIKITPKRAKEVIKMYGECGSKRMVSRDLHMAVLTVRKILDAQGVPA
jgi:DNA invertase Pin-like site-specific DNA recombinase